MEWAAARIAKEVEDNERIEAAAGTRNFIPGSNCNRITHRLSTEEKAEVVKKIDSMRDKGVSLDTAAHSVRYPSLNLCALAAAVQAT